MAKSIVTPVPRKLLAGITIFALLVIISTCDLNGMRDRSPRNGFSFEFVPRNDGQGVAANEVILYNLDDESYTYHDLHCFCDLSSMVVFSNRYED